MKAVGCGRAASRLQCSDQQPPLLSSSAFSYYDLFSLLWLHMSSSRVMVPNSMDPALWPPCLWNHSTLGSSRVYRQKRLLSPRQTSHSPLCFKIFPKQKRREKNLAPLFKNSLNNSLFIMQSLVPGDSRSQEISTIICSNTILLDPLLTEGGT